MIAKLNQRVKDLTQEKEELNNNLDLINKKVFNLEKSEIYQNGIVDRLERERAKLEMMNVEISDKLQKSELDLMSKTKQKENLEKLLEKERKLIQKLKNDAIGNSNQIIELENQIQKNKEKVQDREKQLKQQIKDLENRISGLEAARMKIQEIAGKINRLKKIPFRIEQKMKNVHLFGMKMSR